MAYRQRSCQGLEGSARRWRAARAITVLLAMCETRSCFAAQRILMDVTDVVTTEDLEQSGNCGSGCVRKVVDAVAPALGEIDCELRVENLLDHTDQDVAGGSLNVVHSCSDAEGNALYQGEEACLYSVCATAKWEGDRFSYSVTVTHDQDGFAEHSVRIQVYVNEYEHLPGATDASGSTTPAPALSPGSTSAASPTTPINLSCDLGEACSPATECNSITTAVEIVMEDEFGDGWAGALPGRVDTWSITQALSASDLTDPVGDGFLPYGHYSGVNTLCLEDGFYTFTSTADSAWSDEASWDVCGVTGGTGGTLEFEVGGGTCKAVDDSAASGPPSTDLTSNSDQYCSLPEESPCVGLDVGVVEQSGPSVGMYYDEACLEGGGGVSGCGGGDVTECRLCFVNRELWETDFPDLRTPDWNDCPCCVADALSVTCQGGFVETAPSSSFFDKAKSFYTGGSVAMVATVSGLIVLGVITALCCCRGIHKEKQKALTYKHSRSAIYEDFNDGGTSPDVSPPLRRSSSAGPTKPGGTRRKNEQVPTTAARLSAAEAGKPATRKQQPRQKQQQPRGGKAPRRDGGPVPPAPAATVGGRGGSGNATTALGNHHQPPPRRTALPPVEAHSALRLPGAAKDNPPSDASWPTDPRVGISVSGKKNPRWSGGRELKAYLRRTGYDRVEPEDLMGDEPRLEGTGGNRMLQAMKSASSRLSEKSKQTFDWVEDPGLEMHDISKPDDGGRISMNDIMAALDLDEAPVPVRKTRASPPSDPPSEVALGDLPVQPPPSPGFAAPVPARITAVPKDKNRRSKSKSRARPRGAKGATGDRGNDSPPEDENRRMPSRSSLGGSGRNRSRRVVPTEDADDGEELHTLNKAFAEQNWNAPSADAPPAPVPPSPSTVRDNGVSENRYSAGREGERQGNNSMTKVEATALAAEAAEAVRKRRQGRPREGAADRKTDRGHRSKSEAQAQDRNRHRSTGEGHQHRSGRGQHQRRGRESERRGRGDVGGDANDENLALRSKSNPGGRDRETEGERRRRRAREAGHDSSQGPGQETRGRERHAYRSEHRSGNRTGHGTGRSSSQGQAFSSGRERSVEAHQDRHERRKSAGRKDIHKMLMDESRRVSQERTSKSPGPPQERGQPRPARQKRVSGGGGGVGGVDSRPVARTHVPAAAATAAAKQSSSTRFSSDPRARKERAERLRQRQAKATGRREE